MRRLLLKLGLVSSIVLGSQFLLVTRASAHCPLCVLGAGAVAAGASFLGVNDIVIGIFIGAFSLALGLWTSRLIKKKFVPYQNTLVTLLVFVTTVIPVLPFMVRNTSIYIPLSGDYGSLLNRAYVINYYLLGTPIGALIMYSSPFISMKVSQLRNNKTIPYQGMIITFSLLIMSGLIFQFLI